MAQVSPRVGFEAKQARRIVTIQEKMVNGLSAHHEGGRSRLDERTVETFVGDRPKGGIQTENHRFEIIFESRILPFDSDRRHREQLPERASDGEESANIMDFLIILSKLEVVSAKFVH